MRHAGKLICSVSHRFCWDLTSMINIYLRWNCRSVYELVQCELANFPTVLIHLKVFNLFTIFFACNYLCSGAANKHPPTQKQKVSDPSFQAQDKIMLLYFRTWVINRAVLVLEQYAYKFISQKFGQMQPMCLQLYTLQPCHEYLTASNFGPSDS